MERFDGFHPPDGAERRRREDKNVTQIIAAICGGGDTVVTASERVVGVPGEIPVYEQQWSKQVQAATRVLVAFCGESARHWPIMDTAKEFLKKEPEASVLEVADAIREEHERHRQQDAEDLILKHVLDFGSFEEWRKLKMKVAKPLMMHVTDMLRVHGIDAGILVAGVSDGGARPVAEMCRVDTRSRCVPLLAEKSYGCLGSGSPLSDATMGMWKHTRQWGVEETKRAVYAALRLAMASQGTASGTVDMYVIDKDRVRQLESSEVVQLGPNFTPTEKGRDNG